MADNDQYNDEYRFEELDAGDTLAGSDNDNIASQSEDLSETKPKTPPNRVKRNALIVVVLVIALMLLFKLIGSYFSDKEDIKPAPPVTQVKPIVEKAPVVPTPAPMPVTMPTSVDPKVMDRLSALESEQQSMRSDISTLNMRLSELSSNVNTMVAKMTELNTAIVQLSAKVDEQSHEIEQLIIKKQEMKNTHHAPRKATYQPKYYLQAVIPGRAWLIATNGATLTVREGSIIPGYGMVKLIDSTQGRVLTSSGQVIKFSQNDS